MWCSTGWSGVFTRNVGYVGEMIQVQNYHRRRQSAIGRYKMWDDVDVPEYKQLNE